MKYYLNGKLLSGYQVVKHYNELVQDGQKPNLRAIKRRLSADEILENAEFFEKHGVRIDYARYVRRLYGYKVFLNEDAYRGLFEKYGSKSAIARKRFERAININRLVKLMFDEHVGYSPETIQRVLDHPELDISHLCRYIDGYDAKRFASLLLAHGASREQVISASWNVFEYDY